jgi:dihydroorotate dehydrogenase electron transfer subunit
MTIDEETKIISHKPTGPGYHILTLEAPKLAEVLEPGQFVHVKIPSLEESALRRPFSVFDAEDGIVTILYKQVGRGTEALVKTQPGDKLNVMGPLGHGFPVKCEGVPLLVGGGFGVAPLYFLAKHLVKSGCKKTPILFAGGRTQDDLLALDRFEALGVKMMLATNDGSVGDKGFVTEPLDRVLNELNASGKAYELFTCGPDGLLKAVSDRAVANNKPGWISMDRHMICGVGACFACIQAIKRPDGSIYNARCCVNGPVFKAMEIVWGEGK